MHHKSCQKDKKVLLELNIYKRLTYMKLKFVGRMDLTVRDYSVRNLIKWVT